MEEVTDEELQEIRENTTKLFTSVNAPNTLDGYVNTTALRQLYLFLVHPRVVKQYGLNSLYPLLPAEFVPLIESIDTNSFDSAELLRNHARFDEYVRSLTEQGAKDIQWYRRLFTNLSNSLYEKINGGLSHDDANKLGISGSLSRTILSALFYSVSKRVAGEGTYILGVDDRGRVYRKALPGISSRSPEATAEWIHHLFEIAGHALTFYRTDPQYLDSIVAYDDRWTHSTPLIKYPVITDGFSVGSQFMRFGLDHKQYYSSQPHEVIIRAGDIDTITAIDKAPKEGVVYKVRHANGKITVGEISRPPEEEGLVRFSPSDYLIRGLQEDGWIMPQFSGLYALVGAIARDMFVCEERHKFYKIKGEESKPRKESPRKEPTIRWLPRFKIIYNGDQAEISPSDLEERVFSVAPHYVSGHIRRVENPDPKQLELAKQYGIAVPQGYTFVRPHERSGHEAHHMLYKSRSAVQTLFGAR